MKSAPHRSLNTLLTSVALLALTGCNKPLSVQEHADLMKCGRTRIHLLFIDEGCLAEARKPDRNKTPASDDLSRACKEKMGLKTYASDTDQDGLGDGFEIANGLDPRNPDTDGDGLVDGVEVGITKVVLSSSPLCRDTDQDGVEDGTEVAYNSNPANPDTDGDGVLDAEEIASRIANRVHPAR